MSVNILACIFAVVLLGFQYISTNKDSLVLNSLDNVASVYPRGNLSLAGSRHMPSEESCASMQDNAVDETYIVYTISTYATFAFQLAR